MIIKNSYVGRIKHMLYGFINNLTLLVTLLFIGHVVLGNRLATLQAPLPVRLTFGVGMGAVGAVLLKFSIAISSDVYRSPLSANLVSSDLRWLAP